MNKLKEEINMLSLLPQELLVELVKNSNLDSIEKFCKVNKYTENFCKTQEFKDIIISKIPHDTLDISKLTINELYFYAKVLPLKRKISIGERGAIMVLDNNNLYRIDQFQNKHLIIRDTDINQICYQSMNYSSVNNILLKNNGYVYLKFDNDESWVNENNISWVTKNAIQIYAGNNEFNVISSDKKTYIYNNQQKKIDELSNIVQINDQFLLTDQGEIYIMTKKDESFKLYKNDKKILLSNLGNVWHSQTHDYIKVPELRNVIQITHSGHVLTQEGIVYELNFDALPLTKNNWINISLVYKSLNNIVQICSSHHSMCENKSSTAFLNSNGDVFRIDQFYKVEFKKVIGFKNIIEVSFKCGDIIGLDNKRNIITSTSSGVKTYNLNDLDDKY